MRRENSFKEPCQCFRYKNRDLFINNICTTIFGYRINSEYFQAEKLSKLGCIKLLMKCRFKTIMKLSFSISSGYNSSYNLILLNWNNFGLSYEMTFMQHRKEILLYSCYYYIIKYFCFMDFNIIKMRTITSLCN